MYLERDGERPSSSTVVIKGLNVDADLGSPWNVES